MILTDAHLTQLQETGATRVHLTTQRCDLGYIIDQIRADCNPLNIEPYVLIHDSNDHGTILSLDILV